MTWILESYLYMYMYFTIMNFSRTRLIKDNNSRNIIVISCARDVKRFSSRVSVTLQCHITKWFALSVTSLFAILPPCAPHGTVSVPLTVHPTTVTVEQVEAQATSVDRLVACFADADRAVPTQRASDHAGVGLQPEEGVAETQQG